MPGSDEPPHEPYSPKRRAIRAPVHDPHEHDGHARHDHGDHDDAPPRRDGTVRVDLPVILPHANGDDDQCVDRLREGIASRRGIRELHLDSAHGRSTLCLHYDPDELTLSQVTRTVEKAGAVVTKRYRHETLWVQGMDSGDAAQTIERVVSRLAGVVDIRVNYASERARIEYDTTLTSRKLIEREITGLGYRVSDPEAHDHAHDHDHDHSHAHGGGLLLPMLSGAFLALAYVGETFLLLPGIVTTTAYVAAYAFGGYDIARHGIRSALRLTFDIEFLMLVAALGAAFLGHWAEGGLLLFLFSLGHALEHMAMDRARNAIRALGKLTPKTARVIRDHREVDLPVSELLRGDTVLVRPGERVPIDGRVLSGRSSLDQSPITGESVPVDKTPGDDVFAGSVNGEGTVEVEVTRLARDTTLARVIQMVEEAQTQKSPTQRFTERFERRFVPAVLAGVVAVALVPPLIHEFLGGVPLLSRLGLPWHEAFLRAMTILVAASPCALAISTPAAVLSGIGQGARHGVLFKGGAHLENLGRIRAIAFDKTGTITQGRPRVTEVIALNGLDARQLVALAAGVESHSSHPLARAVVQHAQEKGIEPLRASEATTASGQGIVARVDGSKVEIGNAKLFVNNGGLKPPKKVLHEVRQLESRGRSVMLVRRDGQYVGLVALADVPRQEASAVLARLKGQVEHLVMLTGDNEPTANAIARDVGITEIRASLLPHEKTSAIKRLKDEYGSVAMVGDGINDAPAMAHANVGIAMGAGGTDVALETADVALMADKLDKLPFALALSRQSNRIIRQNLVISLGVIAVLVPAALLGWAGIGPAIVLHEGSTLLVAGNALRLLRFQEAAA